MIPNNIVKNKVIIYLASRYLTYFIQFITSLVIAAELGPFYMGVWGFILLLLNYFQQINFGIGNSFNVLYVHHRENKEECDNYIGNSLVLIGYLSLMVICFYSYYLLLGIEIVGKYHAENYILWVCVIAILQYFTQFLGNVFRIKNLLNCLAFIQSVIVILHFLCICFFRGEELIKWLIISYLVGNVSSIILAVISKTIPSFKKIKINFSYQREILLKGIFLFLSNGAFYFIVISIRTIISENYVVSEFGLFTFSYTVAHAILLLLEALMFIIYPKVLGRLSSIDMCEIRTTINELRQLYVTSSHFLVYLALITYPLFLMLLPQYKESLISLNLISLTVLTNLNGCGYGELLTAKNKERTLAFLSFMALIVNCLLALILVKIVKVEFSYVIMATMLSYFALSFSVMYYGEKSIGNAKLSFLFVNYFPSRLAIPFIVALVISVMKMYSGYMIIPFFLFVFLNIKIFVKFKETIKKIVFKPDFVNL